MIWIDCNPLAGREMKDLHTLLALSPKAFNKPTGIMIGLPTTTADLNEANPFAANSRAPAKVVRLRVRQAKPHPRKQIPEDVFTARAQRRSDHCNGTTLSNA
jgi:mRNA interferase MazF